MIIRLPSHFIYNSKSTESIAYVENGILYMTRFANFEDLMYTITYALKGYDRCVYCGEKLTQKTRTMDHMYPRRWGGISIPENLVPCCKKCNQDKKDMTYDQFLVWRKLETVNKRNEFYKKCLKKNLSIARKGKFILNQKWLTSYDIQEVVQKISFKKLEPGKSEKLNAYYKNWKQYPRPAIVSSNGWFVKGLHILYHARKIKKHRIMVVVLENVVVIDKNTS